MDLIKVEKIIKELRQDFDTVAMAKSKYLLEYLNVRTKETEQMQWYQCIWELKICYFEIKRTLLNIEKKHIEISELEEGAFYDVNRQLIELDIEQLDDYVIGKLREFFALNEIRQSFNKRFTKEEIEDNQQEYYYKRQIREATQDILESGRLSRGNQEALRQIGVKLHQDNGELIFEQYKLLEE